MFCASKSTNSLLQENSLIWTFLYAVYDGDEGWIGKKKQVMMLFKEGQTYCYHYLASDFSLVHDLHVVPNSFLGAIQIAMDMKYIIKT